VPSVAPRPAGEDGDGDSDDRDPEADYAHNDSESAKHIHSSWPSPFNICVAFVLGEEPVEHPF
jgi:hypothetical protein